MPGDPAAAAVPGMDGGPARSAGAAHYQSGRGHAARGAWPEAAGEFERAVALDDQPARYWNDWGVALIQCGRWAEARWALGAARERAPDDAGIAERLARALEATGEGDEALRYYQSALPGSARAHRVLLRMAAIASRQGRFAAAVGHLQEAVERKGDEAEIWDALGVALCTALRIPEALAALERALSLDRQHLAAWEHLLLARHYDDRTDAAHHLEEHRRCGALLAREAATPVQPGPRRAGPLRIAYFSPDFRAHSVGYVVEPLLRNHRREEFTITALSDVEAEDGRTETLRSCCDHWHDVSRLSDQECSELIRAQEIDILVDLFGHTRTKRLRVFAQQPARVQMTALGYPNTTGLRAMQYRLTDAEADPPGAEAYYTEQLARLAPCFLCYAPPDEYPPAEREGDDGEFVYCSFNAAVKISPWTVDCWSEILRRTRRTRLMLKSFELADEETAERLTRDFAARGVERERLTLLKPARTTREHLSAYRRADVALDTHPYSGTVTTLEALLMGVPVVTRGEGRHVSRVTRSILKATGMGQWVAGSREEYVEAAVRAAERRDVSRAAVRRRFLNSPVCDGPGYARKMEALYRLL